MAGSSVLQVSVVSLILLILFFPSLQQDSFFDFSSPSEVLNTTGGRIQGARNRSRKDFVLGGLFPIHTSLEGGGTCGTVRLERGLERMEAMLYSIDSINANERLLKGLTLGYDIRDTCSSENIGLDETVDLVITSSQLDIESCRAGRMAGLNNTELRNGFLDAPTSVVIGAASSRVSVPVASLVRLFTTPQVSYASSSAILSNRDRYGYFYRTIPPDDLQARAMIDVMLHFNWTYVSTIYSRNPYGEPGINEFHSLAETNGICIDLDEGIDDDFSDEKFSNLAQRLLESEANVVILFTSQDNAAGLFKQLDNATTVRRFTWIASDSWARSLSVASNYSRIVAGLIGFVPLTKHLAGFHEYFSNLTLTSNIRNPWFEEFFAAVNKCNLGENLNQNPCSRNSSVPDAEEYEQGNFIPLVVNAVYTFATALDNFLADNCEQPVQWFSNNRTCLNQTRELNGSALLEYIQKVDFTSPTGDRILFDSEGNVEGRYEILNYQANYTEVKGERKRGFVFKTVGAWDSSMVNTTRQPLQLDSKVSFQFGISDDDKQVLTTPPESQCSRCDPGQFRRKVQSSCCGLCESCLGQLFSSNPQDDNCNKCDKFSWGENPMNGSSSCVPLKETFLSYSHPYSVIIMIIAGAGFFPVIFTVVVFAKYWNTPVVKSSGREQMITLLVGISLSFISAFFYVSPPVNVICGIQRWIIWTSFAIMFSALLVKVLRVARIFLQLRKGVTTRVRFTEPQYQVLFTLTLIMLQWIIQAISLAVVHPTVNMDVRSVNGMPNETPTLVYTCAAENIVYLIISVGYETFLVILCTILGIISFNYPENFNEAKYIALCSLSVLVIWIAFIITFFATQSMQELQNIAISLAVVMSGYAVYFAIFGHKLYIIVLKPENNVAKVTKPASTTDGLNNTADTLTGKEAWGLQEVEVKNTAILTLPVTSSSEKGKRMLRGYKPPDPVTSPSKSTATNEFTETTTSMKRHI